MGDGYLFFLSSESKDIFFTFIFKSLRVLITVEIGFTLANSSEISLKTLFLK